MEVQVLISTAELESIFFETFRQELGVSLSQFNSAQLDILSQKHHRAYCLSIAIDICQYFCTDKLGHNHLSMAASTAQMNFTSDFSSFLTRFLFWPESIAAEFLDRFKNTLTNIFMVRMEAITGMNIYDSRQFELRRYEHSLERSSSGERVLHVTFERKEIPFDGSKLAL
jgi:hypothetical protein